MHAFDLAIISYTVTVSGSVLCQINVPATGYYRIFVENTSGANVTVNMAVSIF